MARRKRKETHNDSNRFEQISLFELYVWDDEPNASSQATLTKEKYIFQWE